MKELNIVLKNIIKPILKNYSPVIIIIIRNWSNIIGEKYFDFCEPYKVFFQKNKKNNGTLHIKCFNNVISFYIENNKLFIIEKINSLFGYNLISDIKIKQEPKIVKQCNKKQQNLNEKDKQSINSTIENVENQELRDVLKKLGNSIFIEKNDYSL